MDIDDRIKESLAIIIDRDKGEEFASIVFSLFKDYSMTGLGIPIDGSLLPTPNVHPWETKQELADLIRSLSKENRIVYLIHHKHLDAQQKDIKG